MQTEVLAFIPSELTESDTSSNFLGRDRSDAKIPTKMQELRLFDLAAYCLQNKIAYPAESRKFASELIQNLQPNFGLVTHHVNELSYHNQLLRELDESSEDVLEDKRCRQELLQLLSSPDNLLLSAQAKSLLSMDVVNTMCGPDLQASLILDTIKKLDKTAVALSPAKMVIE